MAQSGNILGKVAVLQGHAYLQRPDGTRVALKIGDLIHEGDIVITGPGAVVEVAFSDGHAYVVHQNEIMMIDASVFSEQAIDPSTAAIHAQAGQLDELNSVIASGGNLDQLFDSAAAGISGGGGSNSGHSFVQLLRIVESTGTGSFSFSLPEGRNLSYPLATPETVSGGTNNNNNGNTPNPNSGSGADTGSGTDVGNGINTGSNTAPSLTINAFPTINAAQASANTPITISGTVSANVPVGDIVTITVDGHSYTGTVLHGGTYSISVPAGILAAASIDVITASVSITTNSGVMTSTVTHEYGVALSIPQITISINSIPTINGAEAASSNPINVTGTVSSNVPVGNTVTLTVDGHNYTGTVQAGGTYSIGVPGSVLASATVDSITASVAMTDTAGNIASASANLNYNVDLIVPPTPTVAFLAADTNGYFSTAATVNATITLSTTGQSTLASGGGVQVTISDNGATTSLNLHLNSAGALVDASGSTYSYSAGVITLTAAAPGNGNTITITAIETNVNGNASGSGAASATEYTPAATPVTAISGAVNGELSTATTGATVNATVTLSTAGQASLASGGSIQIVVNDNGATSNLNLHLNGSGALVDGSGNAYSYDNGVITLVVAAPGNGNTLIVSATETDVSGTVSASSSASALEYTPLTSAPYVAISGAVNGELSSATIGSTVSVTVTLDAAGQASLSSGGTIQITVIDAGLTQNLVLHLNSSGVLVDASNNIYSYSGGVITLNEAAPGSGNSLTVTATETDVTGLISASSSATATEYTPAPATAPTVAIVGAISNLLTNATLDGSSTVNTTITLSAAQQATLTSGGTMQVTVVDAGVTQTLNLSYNGTALVDTLGRSYSYLSGVLTLTQAAPGNGNAIAVTATLTDAAGHSTPSGSATATVTITVPDAPTVALLADGLVGNYYGVTASQISSPPPGYSALDEVDAWLLTKTTATNTTSSTTFPGAIIAPATGSFIATEINYGLNTASTSPTTGNQTIGNNLGTSGNLASWLNVTGTAGPYATHFQTLPGYGTTNQAIVTMTGVIALPTLGNGQEYAMKIFADDGYQVYIDGKLVATVPINQSGTANYFYFTAPATAGNLHSIQILYWDQGGVASMQASVGTINTANQPANNSTTPIFVTPLSILTPAIPGEVTATVTLNSTNQTILVNGGTVLVSESNGTNLTLHQNASGQMVDASGTLYTYVNGVIYIPVATSSSTASISATVVDQYTYASNTAYTGPGIVITSNTNHDGYLNTQEIAAETTAGRIAAAVNLNTTSLANGGTATITVVDAGVTTTLMVSSAGVITGTTANVAATYNAGVVTISMVNPGNGNSATISATQTDQYGHVSGTATQTIVENINTAPAAPAVSITTDANHDGYLSAPELNGSSIITAFVTLNSAAQATLLSGGTVQIHVNDSGTTETLNLHLNSSGTLVNAAGATSAAYSYASGVITLTEPAPGNGHTISITASTTDIAGNASAVSSTATAIQDTLDAPVVMVLGPQHATVSLNAANQAVLATPGSTLTVTASDGTNLVLHQNSSGQLVDASNTTHSYANGVLPLTLTNSTSIPVVTVSATLTDNHGVNSFASNATLVNAGSNSLTDLAGGDTFLFRLSANGSTGTPNVETISAFNTNPASQGGDVLNLADLLTGASSSTTATTLANYLHFTETSNGSGSHTTTIHVSNTGAFSSGYSAGAETLQIVLTNADLLHSAGALQTDTQIIQNLLNQHKLVG